MHFTPPFHLLSAANHSFWAVRFAPKVQVFCLATFLILFLATCQSGGENKTAESAKTDSAADNSPRLLSIMDGKAVMSDSTFTSIPHYGNPDYIIFYCVRHAEKRTDQGDNPGLSEEGKTRAKQLGVILTEAYIDRVFSTTYQRTIQTAETVRRNTARPPAAATFPADMQDVWLDQILTEGTNKRYLVVGHSNTIPQLLNRLTGSTNYQNIPDEEYGRFYIAATKGLGQTEVLEFRY